MNGSGICGRLSRSPGRAAQVFFAMAAVVRCIGQDPSAASNNAPPQAVALATTNSATPPATTNPAASEDSPVLTRTNSAPADGEKPTAPPATPARAASAVAAFRTRPGFKIEVVASEPSVASPAAMAFDENGRLFVAEMRDYPNNRSDRPHLGQIRLLEDPEGEGVFTSSTVFAANLPLPSAVACHGGGVFVAAAPDILFLQDTDGNGVADVRRVVLTGLGDTNSISADSLPHSFYWGLDNRIYGANGGGATTICAPETPSRKILIAGRDFSFDPKTLDVSAETGLALSGQTRDDWGRRFLCDRARPMQLEVIDERYAARNPFVAPCAMVDDIAGPAIPLYRAPLPRPSRVETPTRKTNEIAVAWMTNARGAVFYRGSLFPTNYLGNMFVADADARVIHRVIVRDQGFVVRAERAPEDKNTEFLTCADAAFRPTQVINGPDGALYVSDMAAGGDSGKIYRIAPTTHLPAKPPRLSGLGTRDLAAMLAHTNGWHRDTAARLLHERQDPAAAPLLASMAANSKIPAVRVLALNALAGARALTETLTVQLMGDSDWRVRRAAVKFIEGFAQNGVISDRLWARLRVSAADPYYQVRLQAALSSGAVNSPGKAELLRGTLARDPSSAWMQTAVLSAAPMQAANVMAALAGEPRIPAAVSRPLAGRLAEMAGVSGVLSEAQEVIALVVNNRFAPEFSLNVIGALGEGLHRTRSSLRLLDSQGRLTALFALALRVAAERGASDELRLAGIRVLGTGAYTMSDGGMVLLTLLNPSEPSVVQAAALRSLSFYTAPEVTPGILGKWRSLSPAIRAEALSTLLARTDQVPIALTLIENGNIPAEDALPWHKDLLRTWSEPAISQRASKIFGALETDRAVIVEKFRPTLKLSGAPNRGLAVFEASCSECHSVRGVWETPGPDLAGAKTLGRDSIYESLAAPSRRIASGRLTVVVTTLTGETLVGTVGRETEDTITIREAGRAAAVWPRLNIGSIQPQRWSLMPEGLERTIGPQGMADVIQFLLGAR